MRPESQERNPYVGPRPFEKQDKGLFFGRDREASEIFSLIIAHPTLLLYAQSGAGKTSLLNARLIPLLEEEGFEVLPLARVRGLIPESVQPEEMPNLYVFNTIMSWTEKKADSRGLAQLSLAGFLKEREHPIDEEGQALPRAIIFDQFEELFSFYPEHWEEREGFFRQVAQALKEDPLLRVLFVIREDYLASFDPYVELLPERVRTRYRLERLRGEAAHQAIEGPLQDIGRSFEEGLVSSLVQELIKTRVKSATGEMVEAVGKYVEPVQLQIVCKNLWDSLPPDVTVITSNHLHTFGDVDEALKSFYEKAVKIAARETDVKEGDLRAWFDSQLITPAGTRGTVFRGREYTGAIPNSAVDALENQHIIRAELRAGARWYELTHDRLIKPIQDSQKEFIARKNKRQRARYTKFGMAIIGIMAYIFVWHGLPFIKEMRYNNKLQKGYELSANNEVDKAIENYKKAIEIDPQKATGYIVMGSALLNQGNVDKAIENYKKAIEIAPDKVGAIAYITLGNALLNQGKVDEAVENYKKAIEIDPQKATGYIAMGSALLNKGNVDEAIENYKKAIEIAPDKVDVNTYTIVGNALLNQGKVDEAVENYKKAIEIDPQKATGYIAMGSALLNKGNVDEAHPTRHLKQLTDLLNLS
jgi:tetratricopeptide (TPR) repeat protein